MNFGQSATIAKKLSPVRNLSLFCQQFPSSHSKLQNPTIIISCLQLPLPVPGPHFVHCISLHTQFSHLLPSPNKHSFYISTHLSSIKPTGNPAEEDPPFVNSFIPSHSQFHCQFPYSNFSVVLNLMVILLHWNYNPRRSLCLCERF